MEKIEQVYRKCKDCGFQGDFLEEFFYGGDGVWICSECGSEHTTTDVKLVDKPEAKPGIPTYNVQEVFFGPNTVEIAADSTICDYCARYQFSEPGDEVMCKSCIHGENIDYDPPVGDDCFLGVKCRAERTD